MSTIVGSFHLRGGFYFRRRNDEEIELIHDGGTEHRVVVPVNDWASAIAATSKRGDVREAWDEAIELLNREGSTT